MHRTTNVTRAHSGRDWRHGYLDGVGDVEFAAGGRQHRLHVDTEQLGRANVHCACGTPHRWVKAARHNV